MNVYRISSDATIKSEGQLNGVRTVFSARRTPESIARHETTDAERKVRVCVEQLTGKGKGYFFAGCPNEYWPHRA
jgi:hypothetical protein